MAETNNLSFSLEEIANWTLKEKDSQGKPHASIPSFQRGLVWNPAQIEVLWDSLMRGIPIGVFSLISASNSQQYGKTENVNTDQLFWLLDGQQRANAITLGYQKFPPADDKSSILWIDLLPTDEQRKRSNRKFFFYVTTPAQPWGYKINDTNGENRSGKLSVPERRMAMKTLIPSGILQEKPAPKRLYPITANCPIPFTLLKEAFSNGKDFLTSISNNCCLNEELKKNIKNFCQEQEKANQIAAALKEIKEGLAIAGRTEVTALVAPEEISQSCDKTGKNDDEMQRDSDIAVYFTRLNRGGIPPSNEDLNYSILKSITPSLAKIDDLAERKMHPARLANIAMLCYSSLKEKVWKGQIYRKKVYEFAKDGDFTDFVSNEDRFKRTLEELHSLLVINNKENNQGLPPVLLTSIARNNPALYQMLLILICMRKLQNVSHDFLVGFTTLLAWFNNGVDFPMLYKDIIIDENKKNFEVLCREWLFKMIQAGKLILPPEPRAYQAICEAVTKKSPMDIDSSRKPIGYQAGVNRIWNWTQREAREMLLYVCRDYVIDTFGSYDPASVIWNEDNRPWDYDHIFPQDWIISGQGNKQGKYHELVNTFFNSLGNIAPLLFSLNRSKKDNPPGEIYSSKNIDIEKLFITQEESESELFKKAPELRTPTPTHIECDDEMPFQYVSVIAKRFKTLYENWYGDVGLKISGLLDFSAITDKRKALFKELCQNKLFHVYYVVESGKQKSLELEIDWARPWVACGVEKEIQTATDNNSKSKCLVCIASNGSIYEIGLRRHPEDDKINNDRGRWWFDRSNVSDDIDIKELLKTLRDIAEKYQIQLNEK